MAMVMSTVHLKGISHDKVVLEYLKSNKAEALEIYFDAVSYTHLTLPTIA